MKDLENFIRNNRAAFDDREPSEKVWSNIAASLGFSHGTSLWNSVGLWRAAAVLFMAASVYLFISRTAPAESRTALREFSDVEQFYIRQISEKTAMIAGFRRTDGLNGYTSDFQQLEAMYLVLKEEMKTRPSEKVRDALVLNLLVRIDLLNKQLHHLEEAAEGEKEKPRSQT